MTNGRSIAGRILRIAGMVLAGICFAAALAFLFGIVVMYLWNWLMPGLFGLPTIGFWQAFGLVLLAKLLFGSFGHGGGRRDDCGGPRPPWGRGRHRSRADRQAYRRWWEQEGEKAFGEYLERQKKDA